ncbi:MAG: M4 family metallopeptidase [Bacteroidetes bacterium]|nr:M4 family metallopeptidase [Bacteroidota bacterium]
MKKFTKKNACLAFTVLIALSVIQSSAQTVLKGSDAEKIIPESELIRINNNSKVPSYVQFKKGSEKIFTSFNNWFHGVLGISENMGLKLISTEKDKLGMLHYRYQETINDFPVVGTMYIVHVKNNKVLSMNGVLLDGIRTISTTAALAETSALDYALRYMNADTYRWQSGENERQLKEITGNSNATWYPKGELMVVQAKGESNSGNYKLTYRFDVYANSPLKRSYIFVDANTGEVILDQNRIKDVNVPAIATTVYSGQRPIMTDSTGPGAYRLQETGRGNGIITYNNLKAKSGTGTTDFTNATTSWNNVNALLDQYATDAHWGAEKTYDYLDSIMNRNSIDDLGFKLTSYVHVDVGLVNAFWDGSQMNYGDGNASNKPLTSLDITAHEISHGLTQFTSGLGSGEAGAMNEGFSDCMGNAIRYFAKKSATIDWLIGDEIGTTAFRNMADPKSRSNPDTYKGTYWDSTTNEVHKNSTIFSHAFYLFSQGGSGTNDKGKVFNVTAMGIDKAAEIWYRMNTVYLFPSSDYNDARTYAIQAAIDLYGACSPEVESTTNAWYAVGLGNIYSPAVVATFTSTFPSGCVLPYNISFFNTSSNATNYIWDFGDGTTSTTMSPSHTYTSAGTYNVKLVVSSACGADSIAQSSYVTISLLPAPTAAPVYNCASPSSVTLNASGGNTLAWFTSPTGGTPVSIGVSYVTPSLTGNTTYYVEDQIVGATGNVGSTANTVTGGLHNNTSTQYLIFDVLRPCTLQTVVVNSGAAGIRNVILWDKAGVQLQSIPVNFASGINTVALNLHLDPGKGYQLGGTGMNLWRNNSGAKYPYTLSGVINMTGSSAGSGYYYYYYDWQVQNDNCVSPRVAVTVTRGPTVTFNMAGYDTVCADTPAFVLTDGLPAGGTFSGPGVSAGTFDAVVAGGGNQVLVYSFTDGSGCTNTATKNVFVSSCLLSVDNSNNPFSSMIIYPSPSNGKFTLELGLSQNEKTELKIVNALGQIIKTENHNFASGNNKLSLDISDFRNGVYFIELKTSSNVIVKRITKN